MKYYCAKCGINKTAKKGICDKCKGIKSSLDVNVCGVCQKKANMFFVHGFRCNDHAFQKEPSDAIITNTGIFVFPNMSIK